MKNNYVTYNLKSIIRSLLPNSILNKNSILQGWENRDDAKYIKDRVDYYCRLDAVTNLGSNAKNISSVRFGRKKSVYIFDTYEYTRYFPQSFKANFAFGDINYFLDYPSITKSRPITSEKDSANNLKAKNSVLLNLEKIRHFIFINDPYKFDNKKNILFYRGGVYQEHRIKFFEKYFNNKICDLGHTGSNMINQWSKKKIKIKDHLPYKFLLSLEGNDVASNLKWIMSSNSIAIMPKPKFETWFMEGNLIGDYHYIEIDDNYSNVEEKINYYIKHSNEAKNIINNANKYTKQFI